MGGGDVSDMLPTTGENNLLRYLCVQVEDLSIGWNEA